MLTEEYIIAVYCLVDEMLTKVVKSKLRQRGPQTKLQIYGASSRKFAKILFKRFYRQEVN